MPELTNYVLQQRPIRNIDLGIVQNSLSTITAGNKEALQKSSELRTAIANMDLNEAEDGFRDQLYNDITKTIEDNSIEGNAYYALDDIIKKTGDIGSNPGLLGRLKAQQEYKKYQETLDARVLKGDINQDTADWAKAMNPYYYQDKIDNTGKVIGGTEWKPGITPVKDIDFNDVFDAITKQLKPETGGWSGSNGFLYADGSTGNKFKPGETVGVLSDSSSQYTKLTSDKIKEAIQNAFQNNPELAAQAKQSWDVLKWKAKNNKIKFEDENPEYNGAGGIFNKDGSTKSYDQYIVDMVDGYARTHEYYNKTSKVTYRDAAIARQYDIKTQQGKYKQKGSQDVLASFGNPAKNGYYQVTAADYVDNYNSSSEQTYQYTQSIIKSKLSDFGIKTDADITSKEQIVDLLGTRVLTAEQQTDFNDFIDKVDILFEKYKGDFEAVKAINDKSGSQSDGYSLILNNLQSGIDINSINTENSAAIETRAKYGKLVDRTFGNKNNVGFRFKSEAELNNFINKNGGKNKLITSGYRISGNNIYINKNNSQLLYTLGTELEEYDGDFWRSDDIPTNTKEDFTGGFWWYGKESFGGANATRIQFNDEIWTKQNFHNMFESFKSDVVKKITDANTSTIEEQKTNFLELPQYRISSWSSFEDEVAENSNSVEEILGIKRKKEFDSAAQQQYIDVKNGEHQDEAIRVFNNEGRAVIVDGATKKQILEEMQAVADNAGRGFGAIIDGLGARYGIEYRINKNITEDEINKLREQGAQVVKTGESNEKGKIPCVVKREIILDYWENDDLLYTYNNMPEVINSQRPIGKYFTNSNYYYGGKETMKYGAKPYKSDDINNQWEITIDNNGTGIYISNKDAQRLENIHNDILDEKISLKYALNNLQDKSQTDDVVKKYAAQIAGSILSNYKNSETVIGKVFGTQEEFINYIKSVLGY